MARALKWAFFCSLFSTVSNHWAKQKKKIKIKTKYLVLKMTTKKRSAIFKTADRTACLRILWTLHCTRFSATAKQQSTPKNLRCEFFLSKILIFTSNLLHSSDLRHRRGPSLQPGDQRQVRPPAVRPYGWPLTCSRSTLTIWHMLKKCLAIQINLWLLSYCFQTQH